MTCKEFTEYLNLYLAGELPPEESAAFDAHLKVCANCVRYVAMYRETQDLGKAALDVDGPVPADVPEELIRAILSRIS